MSIAEHISIELKKKLIDWVLDGGEHAVFEKIFLDRSEHVLSVETIPYSGMLVRFTDGREIDIPALPEAFMDQLVGFFRDDTHRHPTWTNIFSLIAINAALETRALRAMQEVADRLGYELKECPNAFLERMKQPVDASTELAFVEDSDERRS